MSDPILLPVSADPTISLAVWFETGSEDDPPGKEGLAHLTGRMLAEASTRHNGYRQILEQLYPMAATYGIRVDREMTTLAGRTHRDNIRRYLALFTDAYLLPAFRQDDFERLKNDAINYLENTLRFSSDEELGKAALSDFVFRGTRYAHPAEGTVGGLRSITLGDVRDFYQRHYTQANAVVALGGSFEHALVGELLASLRSLPSGQQADRPPLAPPPIAGRQVLLVSKPGADASISFGFPIDVHRGDRDFYALWVANSWLGEHRNQAGHLFEVIREERGLNYGDYSYIEAFPNGGELSMPPVNVARRQQLFEVWVRTLPNAHALFALRAAMREVARLVDRGMTPEQFELTRSFLKKYRLHFADTTERRLGYAIDDRFYGIGEEGHLQRFGRVLDELAVEDVNAAVAKYLQYDDVKIAIVTGDAAGMKQALASDTPSPIEYSTPKPEAILEEDRRIAGLPLDVASESITVVPVEEMFEEAEPRPPRR
jgi:zinc protease